MNKKNMGSLARLPLDMKNEIFQHFTDNDLVSLCQIHNRDLYKAICDNEEMWKFRYEKTFQEWGVPEKYRKDEVSWRMLFLKMRKNYMPKIYNMNKATSGKLHKDTATKQQIANDYFINRKDNVYLKVGDLLYRREPHENVFMVIYDEHEDNAPYTLVKFDIVNGKLKLPYQTSSFYTDDNIPSGTMKTLKAELKKIENLYGDNFLNNLLTNF